MSTAVCDRFGEETREVGDRIEVVRGGEWKGVGGEGGVEGLFVCWLFA